MRTKWISTVYGYWSQLLVLLLSCSALDQAYAQFQCTVSGIYTPTVSLSCQSAAQAYCAHLPNYNFISRPDTAAVACPTGVTSGVGYPTAAGETGSCTCATQGVNRITTFSMNTVAEQPNACTPNQGKLVNGGGCVDGACSTFFNASTASSSALGRLCVSGCSAAGNVVETGTMPDGTGYALALGTTYTGRTCTVSISPNPTPSTPAGTCNVTMGSNVVEVACSQPAPNPPPPGKCYGEVNGAVVYVPCTSSTTTSTASTTSTTSNGTATSSTSTQSTSTTTCSAGRCTTTTATGSGSSVGTSTTARDQVSFCKENPTHPSCAATDDASEFGGTCESGFTCSGDAVQCAAAKSSWETRCILNNLQVNTQNPAVQAGINSLAGGDGLNHPKNDKQTVNIASFNTSNPFGASCPPDHTITVMQAQIVIPFSHACGTLQLMGNLLVGLVSLACAFWLVRG
jgi:hypothetical protein